MRRFWFHVSVFLLLGVIQLSLVNIAFGDRLIAPNVLLATVVAWMLRKDFSWVWWRAVVLGLMYDSLSGEMLGTTALLLLWFAYLTSFLSKRFLVEQRSGSGLLTAGSVTAVFAVAYDVMLTGLLMLGHAGPAALAADSGVLEVVRETALVAVVNFVSFFVIVAFIRRFDRYLFSDSAKMFVSIVR